MQEEPTGKPKPFAISKRVVWEAYQRVRANKGAAGVDGESLAEFEKNLKGNLYKLWNRMSSGSYFPPPVRAVEIPKASGGVRVLGVPTVADRIAQTVACMHLEPKVEPIFHPDSYGYRPGRSAKQALGRCRERCWKANWVIDLDIKAFFDTIPHHLILKAVARHTDLKWLLLYVERWLEAPLQREDGSLAGRDRGIPQGSAISPLLANLFMHYCFDAWMARTFPTAGFERYADDIVVHCVSQKQAEYVKDHIARRLEECGLELNRDKTQIVYCKDDRRTEKHPCTKFDFLSYEFRRRRVRRRDGRYFDGFTPAISPSAMKRLRGEARQWRLSRWTSTSLSHLARWVNPRVQGWINYYGAYTKSALHSLFWTLDRHLTAWARHKYKRLHRGWASAYRFLRRVARDSPGLFAHWRSGWQP
ncbi:MAG: group II intron reverse transcriptase/maturase [Candidatus Dormibacteraeota bacterium]|nr:group II intron reverse transcriptase/maturase [Candidatus Dormibacteraeota bacterium]